MVENFSMGLPYEEEGGVSRKLRRRQNCFERVRYLASNTYETGGFSPRWQNKSAA
jgi:hypothetical protein